jgi:hypothetical protein
LIAVLHRGEEEGEEEGWGDSPDKGKDRKEEEGGECIDRERKQMMQLTNDCKKGTKPVHTKDKEKHLSALTDHKEKKQHD